MSSVLCSKGCTYTDVAVHIYIAEALLTDSELELFQTLVGKGVRVYDSPTKPCTTPTKDITAAVVNATSSSTSSSCSSSGTKVPRDKSREYRLTFVVSSPRSNQFRVHVCRFLLAHDACAVASDPLTIETCLRYALQEVVLTL
jgi:hypothetical protein